MRRSCSSNHDAYQPEPEPEPQPVEQPSWWDLVDQRISAALETEPSFMLEVVGQVIS
jgi:hypothetical protein